MNMAREREDIENLVHKPKSYFFVDGAVMRHRYTAEMLALELYKEKGANKWRTLPERFSLFLSLQRAIMLNSLRPSARSRHWRSGEIRRDEESGSFDFAALFIILLWSRHLVAIRSTILRSKRYNPYTSLMAFASFYESA